MHVSNCYTPCSLIRLWYGEFTVKYFIWYPSISTVLRSLIQLLRSIQMRPYVPVDTTGNMSVIEKLVSSGT